MVGGNKLVVDYIVVGDVVVVADNKLDAANVK